MVESFDERVELAKWQKRLLPWAIALLVAMGTFFFVSSWFHYQRVVDQVTSPTANSIEAELDRLGASDEFAGLDYAKWKMTILLENKVVEHRYRQVNYTLLLRTWTRHLGFLTGMVLTFIGSIFVLSKLSEAQTTMSAASASVKGALATSSPGIILAVLGSIIMIVTIVTDYSFSTTDTPAYVRSTATSTAPEDPLPLLESQEARDAEEANLFGNKD